MAKLSESSAADEIQTPSRPPLEPTLPPSSAPENNVADFAEMSSRFWESGDVPVTDGYNLVWIVGPGFSYDLITYHSCGYVAWEYGNDLGEDVILDEKTGQIIDIHGGHGGGGFRIWVYDAENNLFGEHAFGWGEALELYPTSEFATHFPDRVNTLNLVRQIDSNDVVTTGEYESQSYSMGQKYENSKYAVAYGNILISDFIYDVSVDMTIWADSHSGNTNYPNTHLSAELAYKNAIAVAKDDKWGLMDTNGKIIAPFIFDFIVTNGLDTAFVRYDGKWGILDLTKMV